ncbi:MAG: flagellar assembly protein FliW [Cellulomonas sp.]|jgi:flagellar assembly factor FliW|uniref:flagellar assembly protein FliW n=1 Tax=Cellulomonas sp. TaxID=40001 RepID=UPI0019FBAE6E|nr:flagellar assembly protein FliW [Cellulomonas sp.]MBF0689201.1 flagellar assembly protein FliW [Cellulomonas sp.]
MSTAGVTVATPDGPRALPAVLRTARPLPGLPEHEEFTLAPLDGSGAVLTLTSTPGRARPVRLFVVAPHTFFPSYAPEVPADTRATLGLAEGESPVLLAVVHPAGVDREVPSANLLAPLVVHPADGRVVQAVLDGDLPLRAPLG